MTVIWKKAHIIGFIVSLKTYTKSFAQGSFKSRRICPKKCEYIFNQEKQDFCTVQIQEAGFDYSVDNESLETLYWLKWGFVIEITGYVYSQKCKKNAKLNWVITFQILVTFFSKYKQKNASRVSRAQNVLIFSFWYFHYTFDDKYSQWS